MNIRNLLRQSSASTHRFRHTLLIALQGLSFARRRGPRILIVGIGKSGTTALFYKIKHALPPRAVHAVFEPQNLTELAQIAAKSGGVLCKVLPIGWATPPERALLDSFQQLIVVVRDPRDILISRVLYRIWERRADLSPNVRQKWLDLLRAKEADPRRVTMAQILTAATA
jgi:hypothetical protein